MGHEHHRGARPAATIDQFGDEAGIGRVEVEQRLVAQQQHGVGRKCLRDPHPLQLPAGHHPDRN